MVYLPSQHTHSDQLLTGSKRGTKLVHTLVKDAGKEAAKAGAQEVSLPPRPPLLSLYTHTLIPHIHIITRAYTQTGEGVRH